MRRPARLEPDRRNERLLHKEEESRRTFWTVAAGAPDAVGGIRSLARPEGTLRGLDPARTKLGAALAKGLTDPIPQVGEYWLYLGAAAGTTASFVADLVGPSGAVFGVERSVRPFARFVEVAERYPNLLPILGDARSPLDYGALVPAVSGIYADIAQPEQVEIVRENAREFLRRGGALLMALKTASMGREKGPEEHARHARETLGALFDLGPPISLEPFHRRHYFLAGHATKGLAGTQREPGSSGAARVRLGRRPRA